MESLETERIVIQTQYQTQEAAIMQIISSLKAWLQAAFLLDCWGPYVCQIFQHLVIKCHAL